MVNSGKLPRFKNQNLQANFNFRPCDWYTKPLVFNEKEREGLQGIQLLLYGLSGVKLVTVIPVSHHFTNTGLMKYTVIPTVHCYGTINGNSVSKHTHKASDGIIFLLKQGTEHSLCGERTAKLMVIDFAFNRLAQALYFPFEQFLFSFLEAFLQ